MWELQIKLLKMSTPWCVKCLKLAPVCLNDNTTVDPAVSELYTTPVDIPAECVRLIFSLNVISAGRGAESTVNQTGTDPVNSHTHRNTHTPARARQNQSHCTEVSITWPHASP